jgi:hypothetical protein
MANPIAYVVLGSLQGHPGGSDSAPEDEVMVGVFINATFVTVSPGNKTGISGSVVVPFNYGDSYEQICESVTALVVDAVQSQTKVPPRVRIIGHEQTVENGSKD